jgi:hypothetical protein
MIRAGAAEVVITPPAEGTLLLGALAPSTGVHDDLFARALVLDDGAGQTALVGLDLLGLDVEMTGRVHAAIHEQTGIPASHVLVNCSHTHSSGFTLPWSVLGGEVFERQLTGWADELVGKLADLIATAASALRPAALRSGREPVQLGRNRRLPTPEGVLMAPNPAGAVAPWTDVLCVCDMSDKPLAVVYSHAAHPVIIHGASTLVSADYPGYAAQAVRQSLGKGVVPIFVQGCGGNCNAEPLRGGFDAAGRAGARLGDAVAKAVRTSRAIEADRITCLTESVDLPFRAPPPVAEIEHMLSGNTLAEMDLEKSSDEATKRWYDEDAKRCLEQLLTIARAGARSTLRFGMQGLALGRQFCLVGLMHEPFAEYQLAAQGVSPFDHTMVLGYTNGIESYIPCDADLASGGYETAPVPLPGAPLRYRHRLNLAPGVEGRVKGAIGAFLAHLADPTGEFTNHSP